MEPRDTVIHQFAKDEAERLTRSTIKYLQSLKGGLSGDDSGLRNVWNEFCDQVQWEHSFHWEIYEETVIQSLRDVITLLPMHINQAIWLQTDEGSDWLFDNENEGTALDFYAPVDIVADHVYQEYLINAAMNWSNPRIREYIDITSRRD